MKSTGNNSHRGSRSKVGRLVISACRGVGGRDRCLRGSARPAGSSDQCIGIRSAGGARRITDHLVGARRVCRWRQLERGQRNLQKRNYRVVVPGIGLRGLAEDSAYIASYLKQVDGCVVLVGHSYGAAVITNAATGAANAVGLVFVSGLEPDQGERLSEVEKASKDSVLNANLVKLTYPQGTGSAAEYLVNPGRSPRSSRATC